MTTYSGSKTDKAFIISVAEFATRADEKILHMKQRKGRKTLMSDVKFAIGDFSIERLRRAKSNIDHIQGRIDMLERVSTDVKDCLAKFMATGNFMDFIDEVDASLMKHGLSSWELGRFNTKDFAQFVRDKI